MLRKPRRKMTTEERLAKGGVLRTCEVCGAEFWTQQSQLNRYPNGGRYCGVDCKHRALKGRPAQGRPRGPERLTRKDGYVSLWAPDHPRSHTGRLLEHVVVIEQKIGRPLTTGEEVHHINGDRGDNRPENLDVVSIADHHHLHANDTHRRESLSKAIQNRRRDPATGRFI